MSAIFKLEFVRESLENSTKKKKRQKFADFNLYQLKECLRFTALRTTFCNTMSINLLVSCTYLVIIYLLEIISLTELRAIGDRWFMKAALQNTFNSNSQPFYKRIFEMIIFESFQN